MPGENTSSRRWNWPLFAGARSAFPDDEAEIAVPAVADTPSRYRVDRLSWLLILIAPLIVFAPFLFRGYTLSQNVYGWNPAKHYGRVNTPTVRDSISAFQDEPWLAHLRRCLREGWLPLIDLRSGAGTPMAEILQPGVFYPPNLLLPLLPEGPILFDLFSILHVWILTVGLYVLFRRLDAGLFAAPLAILLAMSPITFLHVNMVHYRGHAWFPWMLVALDGVLRDRVIARPALLLLFSSFCAVSAGNPQDAVVSGGCAAVFLVASVVSGVERPWRKLVLGGILLGSGYGVGAVALLPYLVAVKDGLISNFGDTGRSMLSMPWVNWMVMLLPGSQSWRQMTNAGYDVFPELSPTFTILLVLAVLITGTTTARSGNWRWRLAVVCSLAVLLWFVKLARADWFPWMGKLPVIASIRVTKYHTQVFILLAIAMGVVLGRWTLTSIDRRRLLATWAAAIAGFLTIGTFTWLYLYDPVGQWPDRAANGPLARWTAAQTFGSCCVAGAAAIVLLTGRSPARIGWTLSLLMIVHGVCTLPAGFPKRRGSYETVNEIKGLGDRVREGRVATTWTTANTHLFFPDLAYLGTLTPINTTSAEQVLRGELRNMDFLDKWCLAHMTREPLTAEELALMQLLGVKFLTGHEVTSEVAQLVPVIRKPDPYPLIELPGALSPVGSIVPESLYRRYGGDKSPASWLDCWRDVSAAAGSVQGKVELQSHANTVVVTAKEPVEGWLVLSAVYSPYWTLNGELPQRFARHFGAWPVKLAAGETATVRYFPRGLGLGVWSSLTCLGVFLATVTGWMRWFASAEESSHQEETPATDEDEVIPAMAA